MKKKVIKLKVSKNLEKDIKFLITKLGGIKKFIKKDEKVLIKPSFNSPYPFPATTDLKIIEIVTKIIQTQTKDITIGESAGVMHKPTKATFKKVKLPQLAKKLDVKLVNFDEHKWVTKTNKKAKYLKKVKITEFVDKVDKIIFLPTCRTHSCAKFTMSLKVGFGFIKTSDRMKMHMLNLEKKLTETNLYFKPDLIIMDARKIFITGGPDEGTEKQPNIILASTDRTAIDMEGIKLLQNYNADGLNIPIKEIPMIKHALEIRI